MYDRPGMKRWALLLVGLLARPGELGSPSAAGAAAVPAVTLQPVVAGLSGITSITNAGDGRLFLTLQEGQIVVWDGSRILPAPFLDVGALVSCCGEQGLLSVAFHPRYASNGFFFVDYTDRSPGAGATIVARYRVSAGDPNRADPSSAAILLRIPQPFVNHNGGQLQFGPDGFLYVGMGDGGSANDPVCNAQSPDSLLGKLLRIDVDRTVDTAPFYAIPPDNPFVSSGGAPPEAWAKGLRNPWRFSFDRLTGDLFIGDVGQDVREEIDYEPLAAGGGQNYGWKVMEGTRCGDGGTSGCSPVPPPCGDPSYTAPILVYDHLGGACSVTGGYLYRGLSVPDLYGLYVYGDYCSGQVFAAAEASGAWSSQALAIAVPNLTTFGEDSSGDLYLGTQDGGLYRFVPSAPPVPSVTGISPASTATRGAPVTVTGSNFTSSTAVLFGAAPAQVRVVDPATLTAIAPAHAPGTVDVTVSNPGAPPAVAAGAFTYTAPILVEPHAAPRVVVRPS